MADTRSKASQDYAADNERSLDFVQRVIASSAIGLFIGSLSVVLPLTKQTHPGSGGN